MNSHSVWFIGLVVISIVLLIYTVLKSGNKRSLLLYVAMIGLGYTIEFVIMIFCGSYVYKPRILSDPYYDNITGAIISNVMILPVTAVWLAVFRMGWIRILLTAAAMAGIEILFVHLGIYEHHWWRTWYTALGLLGYYWTAKLWFGRIMRPQRGLMHTLTLYFILWAMSFPQNLDIILFHGRVYHVDWFGNPSHDNVAFSASYCLVMSLFFTWLLKRKAKQRWLLYFAGTAVILVCDYILVLSGIMESRSGWDHVYRAVTVLVVLWVCDSISFSLRRVRMYR